MKSKNGAISKLGVTVRTGGEEEAGLTRSKAELAAKRARSNDELAGQAGEEQGRGGGRRAGGQPTQGAEPPDIGK